MDVQDENIGVEEEFVQNHRLGTAQPRCGPPQTTADHPTPPKLNHPTTSNTR